MNSSLWQRKKYFPYKRFLSLNILVFNLFFMWKLQPPTLEKSHPLLSQQSPSNSWGLAKPPSPFWKFGWRLDPLPPPCREGEGVHTIRLQMLNYKENRSFVYIICLKFCSNIKWFKIYCFAVSFKIYCFAVPILLLFILVSSLYLSFSFWNDILCLYIKGYF